VRSRRGPFAAACLALPLALLASAGRDPSWLRHIVVERNLPAKMRDGVTLYADVYRPEDAGPGKRYPALLLRTPYDKGNPSQSGRLAFTVQAVRRGYVVVVQDVRGQFASEGRFVPYAQEIADGYDTVEWVARLPYVDGRVGTFGLSYPGAAQWMTAPAAPPHLAAIAPAMTFAGPNHFFYHGGVFEADFIEWLLGRQIRERRERGLPYASAEEIERGWRAHGEAWMAFRPLADLPLMRGFDYWAEWARHPIESDYWKPYDIEAQHHLVRVPALNVTGWNDDPYGQPGAIRNFTGMRARGATDAARRGQRLVIGPWTHGVPALSRTSYGGVDYGPDAAVDFVDMQLRFFDRWLKGLDDGFDREAPVRIFVIGDNRWREEWEWPPARAREERWYLRAGGALSREPEPGGAPPATYLYDPRHPIRPPPAPAGGPRDYRAWDGQAGILAFTSPPLERDLEVTGQIVARLWLESTAPDTDVTCRFVEVAPDGTARALTNAYGVLRARYRSTERPRPPAPLPRPEPVELEISLGYTSYVVRAGHRFRLYVTGSVLQGLETHLNTWEPFVSMDQATPATQAVHLDARRRSHVVVPIVPR
jgi:putative CocE/NonD family hydrolase